MLIINVVNKKTHTPTDRDVYIGRGGRGLKCSPLANPYKITKDCTREQSIDMYRSWFDIAITDNPMVTHESSVILRMAQEPGGVNLVCWCAPLPCHGDVIKEMIESGQ